jgi:hypothetical protein
MCTTSLVRNEPQDMVFTEFGRTTNDGQLYLMRFERAKNWIIYKRKLTTKGNRVRKSIGKDKTRLENREMKENLQFLRP